MNKILKKIKIIKITRLMKEKEHYINMKRDCVRHQHFAEASEWRERKKYI